MGIDQDGPDRESVSGPVETTEFERRIISRWVQPGPQCFPVVIVASINPRIGDWGAYMGGVVDGATQEDAAELVKSWGAKLPASWATAIFPGIAAEFRYRE